MQAINPINSHTKFGKDRLNMFPSNERKPSVRMPDDGKSKNNMSTPLGEVCGKINAVRSPIVGKILHQQSSRLDEIKFHWIRLDILLAGDCR